MGLSYISVASISDSSPGFSYGRSGACGTGTYLQIDGVPSNKAGRLIPFSTATLNSIFVVCENNSTFTIEIEKRVGVVFTNIYTVTLTNQRTYTETNIPDVEFVQGEEVCVKIGTGSTSNVIVGIVVRGSPL